MVSWACKKQPVTALHSTASEITALHKGATKTVLLCSFLQSIGFPLSSASPTYEDNTGTIKLIRTNRLTDTVRHHAVKISWPNEHYLNNNLKMANTKTSLMLVDCNTQPVNGSQLFSQISYA
ncbi:MAG: Ty1/Copia family ribonuclease HI, partial [bacterium]